MMSRMRRSGFTERAISSPRFAILGGLHAVAAELKVVFQSAEHDGVVFHDEDEGVDFWRSRHRERVWRGG